MNKIRPELEDRSEVLGDNKDSMAGFQGLKDFMINLEDREEVNNKKGLEIYLKNLRSFLEVWEEQELEEVVLEELKPK